jgi:hypothetical protein
MGGRHPEYTSGPLARTTRNRLVYYAECANIPQSTRKNRTDIGHGMMITCIFYYASGQGGDSVAGEDY